MSSESQPKNSVPQQQRMQKDYLVLNKLFNRLISLRKSAFTNSSTTSWSPFPSKGRLVIVNSPDKANVIYVLDIPSYIYKTRIIVRFIKRKLGIESGKKETIKSLFDLLKWTDVFQKKNLKEIKRILSNYEDKVVWIKKVQEVDRIIMD